MTIQEATDSYEAWMKSTLQVPPGVDAQALDYKHGKMKDVKNAFPFLRATFYRWAQRWQEESGSLGEAARVLAVGDLHLENFGTWKDVDGHLIWGINDFDEAWDLPWTSDLVRLGVSSCLALGQEGFNMEAETVCRLILDGYMQGMKESAGAPFDLTQEQGRLLEIANAVAKPEDEFWREFDAPTKWKPIAQPPPQVELALRSALPEGASVAEFRVQTGPYNDNLEPSGLGSLGRARYCVLARSADGERIVREAKVLLPSAVAWAEKLAFAEIKIDALLQKAKRCPDPWFRVNGRWAVRRIAPEAVKISLKKLKKGFKVEDQAMLFRAMGRETANIHLGSARVDEVLADLEDRWKQDVNWFAEAVEDWRKKVEADWRLFDPTKLQP